MGTLPKSTTTATNLVVRSWNHCPLCAESQSKPLYAFENSKELKGWVVTCDGCGIRYKKPVDQERPATEYYDDDFADREYWKGEEHAIPHFRVLLTELKKSLSPMQKELLDAGCGPGTFTKEALDAGFKVTGLELNDKLAEKAVRYAKCEIIRGDLMSAELHSRKFDAVTMLDLVEHLQDPVAGLRQCASLLRPGGRLAVYTPNHAGLIVKIAEALYRLSGGRIHGPVDNIFDCTHVTFFDPPSLRRAIESAGLLLECTFFYRYDPERSNQSKGISATVLKVIETLSPWFGGCYRIFMIARKPA